MNRRHQTLTEWSQTGTLLAKPSRGWIHPDHQLSPDAGVTYGVRYTGAMPVQVSMKSVDFDTRSKVAKECISAVCEAAGMKLPSRGRKKDKKLLRLLGDRPIMRGSGCNANITITTECITVVNTDTGEMITNHNLFNVSFASGGEAETIDFVSFVAKDDLQGRACHVIESPGGLASDIISTIGQAFEVRYKDHIGRGTTNSSAPRPPGPANPGHLVQVPERNLMVDSWGEQADTLNGSQHMRGQMGMGGAFGDVGPHEVPTGQLIDMDPVPSQVENSFQGSYLPMTEPALSTPGWENFNDDVFHSWSRPVNPSNDRFRFRKGNDVYTCPSLQKNEMRPAINIQFPPPPPASATEQTPPVPPARPSLMGGASAANVITPAVVPAHSSASGIGTSSGFCSEYTAELANESWFHGRISRLQAEEQLTRDGDFLVRESTNAPPGKQFVLSGRQHGRCKHLLLIDPDGKVRTKEREFPSVGSMVHFHLDNSLPIISKDFELQLRRPVTRQPYL